MTTPLTPESDPLEQLSNPHGDHVDPDLCRSVPQIINAAFDLVRQNSTPFWKGMIWAGGPVIVLALVIAGFYANQMMLGKESFGAMAALGIIALCLVLYTFARLTSFAFAFAFAFLSLASRYGGEKDGFNLEDIKVEMKNRVGTALGMILFIGGSIFVSALFTVIISQIFPVLSTMLMVIGILLLPFLLVTWGLVMPVRMIENIGTFASFPRAASLIRGRWWRTAGLLCTLYLLHVIISSLALIGLRFLMSNVVVQILGLGFSDGIYTALGIIASAISGSSSAIIWVITMIALALHYHSQLQRLEAPRLLAEIETIGDHRQKGMTEGRAMEERVTEETDIGSRVMPDVQFNQNDFREGKPAGT